MCGERGAITAKDNRLLAVPGVIGVLLLATFGKEAGSESGCRCATVVMGARPAVLPSASADSCGLVPRESCHRADGSGSRGAGAASEGRTTL